MDKQTARDLLARLVDAAWLRCTACDLAAAAEETCQGWLSLRLLPFPLVRVRGAHARPWASLGVADDGTGCAGSFGRTVAEQWWRSRRAWSIARYRAGRRKCGVADGLRYGVEEVMGMILPGWNRRY
jgi:hypothetical protein